MTPMTLGGKIFMHTHLEAGRGSELTSELTLRLFFNVRSNVRTKVTRLFDMKCTPTEAYNLIAVDGRVAEVFEMRGVEECARIRLYGM